MDFYQKRCLERTVTTLSKSFPVILVTGARQVGKTTLLQHLSQSLNKGKRRYVSLDEFEIRSLAQNDPGLFLQQYPPPILIDEIQYAPQLLSYIKADVDRTKEMGSFWLTGSQQFHLMKNVSESLAGRVGILHLYGLSLAEEYELPFDIEPWTPDKAISIKKKAVALSLLSLFKKIVRGFFPRLLHKNAPPLESFYGSYVQTYIDRDLRDLVKVSNLSSFSKFIRLCAARTASILNLSDLARDSDIAVNTAKEWLSLLQSGGHIFLLYPYYRNISKRLIKSPKMYFLDTGLACYLTGWKESQVAAKGAFAGHLFETFVIGELIKSYAHRGLEPSFYYFRTKDNYEIDLLMEKNGILMPIEIKLSSLVKLSDLKGINHLRKMNLDVGDGAVVALPRQSYPLANDLMVVSPTVIQ